MVLVIRHLEPQFGGVFLCAFIAFVFFLVCGIAAVPLWLYLLPQLGSLLAKWRRHIPPFFRILPFDSSDWMIFDIRWICVFLELFGLA
jgi:hypothetical protein